MNAAQADDAQREERRMLALRHVRQYPDPVLRRKARDVEQFDDELRQLVDRMYGIMNEAMGVGLAAPQLGLLLRVFTYHYDPESSPQALVNPVVEWSSDETDVDEEGCLSLGDVRLDVERPVSVRVTGRDVEGAPVELELEGFPARVFQHEIDHLDGVLAFDRAATAEQRKQALQTLRPQP